MTATAAVLLLAVLFHLAWPPILVAILGTLPALYLAWLAVPGVVKAPESVAAENLGAPTARDLNVSSTAGGLAAGIIENLNLTVPRLDLAGRPVSLLPRRARPAMLEGREEFLDGLHARLTHGDGSWPRIVAIHGLGGAGKTSAAVEYAHRQRVAMSVAWQFQADDPDHYC